MLFPPGGVVVRLKAVAICEERSLIFSPRHIVDRFLSLRCFLVLRAIGGHAERVRKCRRSSTCGRNYWGEYLVCHRKPLRDVGKSSAAAASTETDKELCVTARVWNSVEISASDLF